MQRSSEALRSSEASRRWILVDTTYREQLRRLRSGRKNVVRFIAKCRNGEEVVVAPPLEAMRLVASGEITVYSEPLWRMFSVDLWCIVQKLVFYLLDNVEFIVTTGDLTVTPPDNVKEDDPNGWGLDYTRNITLIKGDKTQ